MNIKKSFSFLLLLVAGYSYSADYGLFKKIVVGIPAILLGHYASEYMSTTAHELGHSLVNKAFTGDPVDIKVTHNDSHSLLEKICIPWLGTTFFKTRLSPLKDSLMHASGPVMGIITTKAQIHFLELCIAKNKGLSQKEMYTRSLLQPFTFLKDLSQSSKNLVVSPSIKKNLSLKEFIVQGIIFFRVSRLIGESCYGFLPCEDSDGIKIWYNCTGVRHPLNVNLVALTAMPIITSISYGILAGLYERFISTQHSAKKLNIQLKN